MTNATGRFLCGKVSYKAKLKSGLVPAIAARAVSLVKIIVSA